MSSPNLEMRWDDDTMQFAARELTKLRAKTYERRYPAKKMSNGQILPIVQMSEASWADEVEIEEYDRYGMASVIADYSKGGQRVGTFTRRVRYPIKTVGSHVGWSLEEINKARYANRPLSSQRLQALRESFDNYIDQNGYYGDSTFGLDGLLTLPLPTLVAGQTLASITDADVMLATLNSWVRRVIEQTNGIETPKKLVMPEAQRHIIFSTYRAHTDMSVGEAFLKTQREQGYIQDIVSDVKLSGAVNGQNVAFLLPDDEEAISIGMPVAFTMTGEQVVNLETVIHAYGRTSLVMCARPLACLKIVGI